MLCCWPFQANPTLLMQAQLAAGFAHLQAQVAEWAQRDGQPRISQVLHQLRILQAAYAVVDALHAQRADGAPHVLGAALFSCGCEERQCDLQ